MRRLFPTFAVLAVAAVALGACGKAGKPMTPADSQYPRTYPQQASPTAAKQRDGRALPPEWDQQDLDEAKRAGQVFVDPSVRQQQLSQPLHGTVGATPLDQGIGAAPRPSPLPPVQPAYPEQATQ